jgi:hypothetical protein
MPIYDKPVWRLMWDMVEELGIKEGKVFSKDKYSRGSPGGIRRSRKTPFPRTSSGNQRMRQAASITTANRGTMTFSFRLMEAISGSTILKVILPQSMAIWASRRHPIWYQ